MMSEQRNLQARIPAELHTWLKMQALREDMTLADLVIKITRGYRETALHTDSIVTIDENSQYPGKIGEWK